VTGDFSEFTKRRVTDEVPELNSVESRRPFGSCSSRTRSPLADSVPLQPRTRRFGVIVAGDGRRALERFRADKPSLVILDLMLPDCRGSTCAG